MSSASVIVWSAVLPVVAVVNMVAWVLAAKVLWRRQGLLDPKVLASRRLQLVLSAGYVLGCAYRSVLPVFDVPRIALVDSFWASAVMGRSVATIAELCFIAQWALLLRDRSRATGDVPAGITSRVVIPLIVTAEICSWYSVLSTSNLGHVFEESLWSVATALIVASLIAGWQRWDLRWWTAGVWLAAGGAVYFAYLVSVDIPMYLSRWIADERAGKVYLSLAEGWLSGSAPHVVTYSWAIWKSEMAWMAGYFTVGVWISIWLVHAPVPHGRLHLRKHRQHMPFGIPGVGVLMWRRSVWWLP